MTDTPNPSRTSFNPIKAIFLDHPASVDESFWQHFRFALTFSFWLFCAAFAALVHALIPCMFEKTGSNIIRRLYAKIEHRGVEEQA